MPGKRKTTGMHAYAHRLAQLITVTHDETRASLLFRVVVAALRNQPHHTRARGLPPRVCACLQLEWTLAQTPRESTESTLSVTMSHPPPPPPPPPHFLPSLPASVSALVAESTVLVLLTCLAPFASSDGRLRRLEKFLEEVLIYGEENERNVAALANAMHSRSIGGDPSLPPASSHLISSLPLLSRGGHRLAGRLRLAGRRFRCGVGCLASAWPCVSLCTLCGLIGLCGSPPGIAMDSMVDRANA